MDAHLNDPLLEAEHRDLLSLVDEISVKELDPIVSSMEAAGEFPRELFKTLGDAGLLGMPYRTEFGGAALPYSVYLRVLERLSQSWLAVGLGTSVHTLSAFPLAAFGSDQQILEHLPAMIGGEQLGAYALSESHSGSDASALSTRADLDGDHYVVNGAKAWITHGGQADYYATMVRTGPDKSKGISCLLVTSDTPGISFGAPERKMGMRSSPTAAVVFDEARVPVDSLIGAEGQGFTIAMAALDAGRLGIAACAVGLAQAALDASLDYARVREQFGRPIARFQGVEFMLADMAASISAARSLYLDAARLKDAGRAFGTQAAMAKLVATDACMRVAIDAVQVLGGSGYVEDFPVERYLREAKVLQIVEGTNQVQRLVIGRSLVGR